MNERQARTPALRGLLVLALALCVTGGALAQGSTTSNAESARVASTLQRSAKAFERGDRAAATRVWSNSESLTVYEGNHVNRGWADYRDNHLGPK